MNLRKVKKKVHFHSEQRWGISIVLLIILAIIVFSKISTYSYINTPYDHNEHMAILEDLQSTVVEKQAYKEKTRYAKKKTFNLRPFDPNTVTESELTTMGIKESMAKSWTKYTSKGGKFYKVNDLKKLYVMNDYIFKKLQPYVVISPNQESRKYNNRDQRQTAYHKNKNTYIGYNDSTYYKSTITEQNERKDYQEKFKEKRNYKSNGVNENYIFSINLTDSIELQSLKGIGPVLSARIIKYRDALGGFHNLNQLLEVYGVKPALLANIKSKINFEGKLNKIPINTINQKDLIKHPYFNYITSSTFINYREHHGPFRSIEDVKKIQIIKTYWLDEVAPYFDFDTTSLADL